MGDVNKKILTNCNIKKKYIFAASKEKLTNGVKVALQVLVLSVLVRIQVGQLYTTLTLYRWEFFLEESESGVESPSFRLEGECFSERVLM